MTSGNLNVVIVDDDEFQLAILSTFVERTKFLHLLGAFHNPIDALEAIINEKPDIAVVDIELPELSGFEMIKALKYPPELIIISAKKDYASEAFEVEATDYMLKPIEYPRFLKAVTKAKRNIDAGSPGRNDMDNTFFVKNESLLVRVDAKEILYLEAFGDYVKIFLEKNTYLVHGTFTSVEKKLSATDFMKVHRSFIVRLDKIENIDQANLQVGKKIIPISQSHRPKLLERVNAL
ncbi:MAG: response regulator transcription factor [Cyclobacteriaceae bacterium]|nr:response regulator transcription factor [Cyclobacteriaceae bacterium HetDA_MAG_MS6]